MSEDPRERAEKYIRVVEGWLGNLEIKEAPHEIKDETVQSVIDAAERYLKDARYFLSSERPVTSLASVAYAEGILDALDMLGLTGSKKA